MKYISTRGGSLPVTAAQAITQGIAFDGGLYVPETIPQLKAVDLAAMSLWSYQQKAIHILKMFLTDFPAEQIQSCVQSAYNETNFSCADITPLVQLSPNCWVQELWHGPTQAFKDMALQILPHFLTAAMDITHEKNQIAILTATSGDTGKAALAGFRDVPLTQIIVFYPKDGVSEVQKRQMTTQEGNNVQVLAVSGNFDDAQAGVKAIFNNTDLSERLHSNNWKLSSANSINWGRLLPQIVYYIDAYSQLLRFGALTLGQEINIVVPTGNFGNILAAFYAKTMGLPVKHLICASNTNNILTDFINTGIYDRNRTFFKTLSPSMDILISSNLERLLYHLCQDSGQILTWMEELAVGGKYDIGQELLRQLQSVFQAGYCDDNATIATIKQVWEGKRYLCDTHTAVALNVYEQYRNVSADSAMTLIVSTASPFKFGRSVAQAILDKEIINNNDEFALMEILSHVTGIPIPQGLQDLANKSVLHTGCVQKTDMLTAVQDILL